MSGLTAQPTIRAFRDADAAALAEWLGSLAPADEVYTAASLVHQRRRLPARRRPLWLVAIVKGELVGLGREDPQVFGGQPGLRRTWVGVRADWRRRGLGGRLWQHIEAHARLVGGLALRSWAVADCAEAEPFLLARGFSRVGREVQWWVDPALIDPAEIERSRAAAWARGFRVSTLDALPPSAEPAVRELYLAADRTAPGHHAAAPRVAVSTFRCVILGNPLLDRECSTVVLYGDQPVALCWLKGDRHLGRYGIEFTATAAGWRGQGLAVLAKLSALQLAARAGVRWVGTSNDEANAPMLAINQRLGHTRLPDLLVYERSHLA